MSELFYSPISDSQLDALLATARSGEDDQQRQEAAGELCRELANTVHQAIRGFRRQPADSEDLAQDSYERIVKSVLRGDTYTPGTNLRGLTHRIATNRGLDVARREARVKFVSFDRLYKNDGDGTDDIPDHHDTETEALSLDSAANIQRLFEASGCPTEMAQAVCLFHVTGLSYAQIAEHTGVPIGTVRSRISRGLDRVRKHFGIEPGAESFDLFEELENAS